MAKAIKTPTKKSTAKKASVKSASKAKTEVEELDPVKAAPAKKAVAKKAAAKKATAKPAKAKAKSAASETPAAPEASAPSSKAPAAAPKKKSSAKKAASSTTKKSTVKKSATKTIKKSDIDDDDEYPIRVDKPCPFSAAELAEWRLLLRQRYMEVSGDIKDLLHDAMDSEDGHTMPTHQADRGFDSDLQDLSLGMLGDEETLLWQIERAIHKIETGSPIAFGLCEYSHKPIPVNRLSLLPWTPLSIQGAAYMEERGFTLHDMIIDE